MNEEHIRFSGEWKRVICCSACWTANKWYQPKFKESRKLGSATPGVVPLFLTISLPVPSVASFRSLSLQPRRGWISRFRTLIVFRKEPCRDPLRVDIRSGVMARERKNVGGIIEWTDNQPDNPNHVLIKW